MKEITFILAAYMLFAGYSVRNYQKSDSYLRDRVVMLRGNNVSCTGVQVHGKSGKTYILTASHCRPILAEDGTTTAITENDNQYTVNFIAEDPDSDLMLLSSPNRMYIDVAKSWKKHEHIHTMTHGKGMPSYRTDGEMLLEEITAVGLFNIDSQEAVIRCGSMPKFSIALSWIGPVCVLSTIQEITTAPILPGSSGGPLVNKDNELIGIASATDNEDTFSTYVTLSDIHRFLKDK